METNSEELWKKRLINQKFELIGTSEPGEGNGYHDRISFNSPHRLNSSRDRIDASHWLYTVYFRDLSNRLNPKYSLDRGESFHKSFELKNCSKNYKKTFYKYLNASERWADAQLLTTLGDWSRDLIYRGRVILEFVSWYDNKTGDFYAYQLKNLNLSNCKIKGKQLHYSGVKQNDSGVIKDVEVKIPINKCIIIEWPKQLGGYKDYKKTVDSILNMGSKIGSIEDDFKLDPNTKLKEMQDWNFNFNKKVSSWGIMHFNENTTDFYKQYNAFKLNETIILCIESLIEGLKQLVFILNKKLSEEAYIAFDSEQYKIDRHIEVKNNWLKGDLSFKEAATFLERN